MIRACLPLKVNITIHSLTYMYKLKAMYWFCSYMYNYYVERVTLSWNIWKLWIYIKSLEQCNPRALVFGNKGRDVAGIEGILASTSTGIVTDTSWKCTTTLEDDWTRCFFNDDHWPNARRVEGPSVHILDISSSASWIWAEGSNGGTVYCRKRVKGT